MATDEIRAMNAMRANADGAVSLRQIAAGCDRVAGERKARAASLLAEACALESEAAKWRRDAEKIEAAVREWVAQAQVWPAASGGNGEQTKGGA